MKLGYQTNTWGGVVGHPGGVVSVKDAYYLANGSTKTALEEIRKAGYGGFELFDGNLMQFVDRKEEFSAWMREYGLFFVGVYTGGNFIFPEILEEEIAKIEKVAKLASGLGAEHLVIGGGAVRSNGIQDEDYILLGKALDRIAEIAESNHLIPSYHPHMGTCVETPEQLDRLMSCTSINICPDTAHIEAGGGDPVETVRKYIGRIRYIHLKDYENGTFLPLGKGHQKFAEIINLLKEADYSGWVTVELDEYADPIEGAKISRDYLRKLDL
ncbi:xylose isomerase [Weizmannia acidilactici]|uniref:sugar phosphate isomerase/epimerase family protein n=1 Tax=Weizmannia acidilactici TaxID=2607726 RepID=UPI00124EEE28|nr:sugar phosphate isomerase/epimerase family protein [Weizmannia acidilactici]GER68343.1 xylose isomerase [Weizmannia acidilactici]